MPLALRLPRREKGRENTCGNWLLVESKPDFNRQAPLPHRISASKAAQQIVKPERRDLRAISVYGETEPARRRQPCLCQGSEVRGLWPDVLPPFSRRIERDDEPLLGPLHRVEQTYATFSSMPAGQLTPMPPSPQ